MFVVVLVALGIIGVPVALGLAWLLHALRLLPLGITAPVATPLLTLTGITALLIVVDMNSLLVEPAAMQRKLLGRSYAYPWELREHAEWGFQDPGELWAYRVSPERQKLLEARCKRDEWRKDTCWLGSDTDDSGGTSIRLYEGRMEIVDQAF